MSLKAEEAAPYSPHFNPANGFKPAQRSLTDVFLQMAGSFERFGTPEPYLRHVMAEHARIDARYKLATGKEVSRRPEYFTDAYLENLIATWKKLAPVLDLESLCRQSGRDMRLAILGSWNRPVSELVADEQQLNDQEKAAYRALLNKDYFSKTDFTALEAFYKGPHDKLTEQGKNQLSRRVQLGTLPPEKRRKVLTDGKSGTVLIAVFNEQQRKTLSYLESDSAEKVNSDDLQQSLIDRLKLNEKNPDTHGLRSEEANAMRFSHAIRDAYVMRLEHLHKQPVPKEQADKIEKALDLLVKNILVAAQSEFEAALNEELADSKNNH
ncbi:hypothetical protein ACFSSA_09235 [Luteolibacter algae]|uniref:DUF3102 domain-containing protein n=1 Tax=Luteolibacter algae TaxID=454151 RepID=A0ABW5D6Z6_9BACT